MYDLIFFNQYHNGDILHSKAFIQDVKAQYEYCFGESIKISHARINKYSNFNLLEDIDIPQIASVDPTNPAERINNTTPIAMLEIEKGKQVIAVNTWIGSHFNTNLEYDGECTLRFAYNMWNRIYYCLNYLYRNDILKLKPIKEYLPSINYAKLDTEGVDLWLEGNRKKRKVLVSNGPVFSGQCVYTGDMSEIVVSMARAFPEDIFITTQKLNVDMDNLFYTGDIINPNRHIVYSDLNEISYLSTQCSVIIGRNSGPFCFSATKDNLNDKNKVFYSFGSRSTDVFAKEIDTEARMVFRQFDEGMVLDVVQNDIYGLLV